MVLLSCSQKWPLLVLHGGPGLPSRYLETLELLAGQDRRVIFYDQVISSHLDHCLCSLTCPCHCWAMQQERLPRSPICMGGGRMRDFVVGQLHALRREVQM